jgi:hypothetical protein
MVVSITTSAVYWLGVFGILDKNDNRLVYIGVVLVGIEFVYISGI